MSGALAAALRGFLGAGEPVALVTVERALGSTPREAGVAMLVTAAGRSAGTIGGGRLEWEATARARALLDAGEPAAALEVPLGPAVGQCCGGHVALRLRRAGPAELAELAAVEAAEAAALPAALLFGAGHVGRALAAALAPLPLRLRWIDPRPHEFPTSPPPGVEVEVTGRLVAVAERAPPGAAFLVVTHSHALDFEVCATALARGDFAYLGLIGSRTKRARFERGLRELGVPAERVARLVCPIGGTLRDKRPAVIAALAAAELLVALVRAPTTAAQATHEEVA